MDRDEVYALRLSVMKVETAAWSGGAALPDRLTIILQTCQPEPHDGIKGATYVYDEVAVIAESKTTLARVVLATPRRDVVGPEHLIVGRVIGEELAVGGAEVPIDAVRVEEGLIIGVDCELAGVVDDVIVCRDANRQRAHCAQKGGCCTHKDLAILKRICSAGGGPWFYRQGAQRCLSRTRLEYRFA